ncbi:MAG: T9SS C-terminal target domain-containing protein [Bacteroidetes bacterium]|nr:MAG: T9SS C-terminal target domain-containing protein [Bacteroidota bacterium]
MKKIITLTISLFIISNIIYAQQPALLNIGFFSDTPNNSKSISTDKNGNLFYANNYRNSGVKNGFNNSQINLDFLIPSQPYLLKYDKNKKFQWVVTFQNGFDITNVISDQKGGCYVFMRKTQAYDKDFNFVKVNSNGVIEIEKTILKYGTYLAQRPNGWYDGQNLRTFIFYGNYDVDFNAGKLDSKGNIYLVGRHNNIARFGDDYLGFIYKISSTGEIISSTFFEKRHNSVSDINFDDNGNIYLCGYYDSEYYPDPSYTTLPLTISNVYPYQSKFGFFSKYDSTLNLIWSKRIEVLTTAGSAECKSISIDSNNDILVTGNFNGIVDFDPSSGEAIRTGSRSWHYNTLFVAKYDNSGNYKFASFVRGNRMYHNSPNFNSIVNYGAILTNKNSIFFTGTTYADTITDQNGNILTTRKVTQSLRNLIGECDSNGNFSNLNFLSPTLGGVEIIKSDYNSFYITNSYNNGQFIDFDFDKGISNLGLNIFGGRVVLEYNFKKKQYLIVDSIPILKNSKHKIKYTKGETGNNVSFSSSDSSIFRVSQDSIIIINNGIAELSAFQQGNTIYNDAQVHQTITISGFKKTNLNTVKSERVDFSIYPNPSSGNFIIENSIPFDFCIYSQVGVTVRSGSEKSIKHQIIGLNPGIYFVKINNLVKKIIVQ